MWLGVTPHPNAAWMIQVARNVTMEEWRYLSPGQYLIHHRDTKFCPAFQQLIDDAAVERIVRPPRSPNLHAYAERWGRSVKDETRARLMLFGEGSRRHVLNEYMDYYHQEHNHRGQGNIWLFPPPRSESEADGPIQCRERLGGLLECYERKAA